MTDNQKILAKLFLLGFLAYCAIRCPDWIMDAMEYTPNGVPKPKGMSLGALNKKRPFDPCDMETNHTGLTVTKLGTTSLEYPCLETTGDLKMTED